MPRSYRVHRIAIGILVALALPLAAVGQQLKEPERPATPRAQPQPQSQPQPQLAPQPPPISESTLRGMFDEAMKILADNKAAHEPAEQRRESREISDLAAQWEQARWAKWAVIVAIGGFGANAAAILLVWLTFRQARRTADAALDQAKAANEAVAKAQETAQSQSRAYLSIDPKLVLNWRQPRHLGISFDLHNHGKTVGRHISYLFDMAISPRFEACARCGPARIVAVFEILARRRGGRRAHGRRAGRLASYCRRFSRSATAWPSLATCWTSVSMTTGS